MKTFLDSYHSENSFHLFYKGKCWGELATAGSFSQHPKLFEV